jgi:peptidoglycan/LPS O-acetylase OafA/YrhL
LVKLLLLPWQLLSDGLRDLREIPVGNRPCLDLLRTLAITLVFCDHTADYFKNADFLRKMPFVRFGWGGVDLFFVLSGLLIGGQLWRELRRTRTVDVKRFVLRRGFRIWPVYFSLVLILLGEHIFLGWNRSGLWADAIFVSNYFHHHQVGGGWSLSTEEQFYLLIPILLAIGAKFLSQRSMIGAVVAWIAVLPLIRYLVTFRMTNWDDMVNATYYPSYSHADGLAMGLFIAWLLLWHPEILRIGRWLDFTLAALFIVGICSWYIQSIAFQYSFLTVTWAALTLLLLRIQLPSVLRSKVFYATSRLSYSFYLIHWGLLRRFVPPYHVAVFGSGNKSFLLALVIWGIISLGLAFLSFSWIELPFLKLRERVLAKKRETVNGAAYSHVSMI